MYCLFAFSRAAPAAYGGSQAGALIGATAAGPHHSRSKPDPEPTEQGQGSNPQPHGSSSDSLTTAPQQELRTSTIFNLHFLQASADTYFMVCVLLLKYKLLDGKSFLLFTAGSPAPWHGVWE